jgi:hypothetical protein
MKNALAKVKPAPLSIAWLGRQSIQLEQSGVGGRAQSGDTITLKRRARRRASGWQRVRLSYSRYPTSTLCSRCRATLADIAYQDFCSGIDLDRAKNANRTPFAFAVVSTVGTCMM